MSRHNWKRSRTAVSLLVTIAIIASLLLSSGTALGLTLTFNTQKASLGQSPIFKLGETVVLTTTIALGNLEFADIQSTTLSITSTDVPNFPPVSVTVPLSEGTHDLTSQLPKDDQGTPGDPSDDTPLGTLTAIVAFADIAAPPTGYGYSYGYLGTSASAKINITINYMPPIFQFPQPTPLPFADDPQPKPRVFDVPGVGGGGGGGGFPDVTAMFDIPGAPGVEGGGIPLGMTLAPSLNKLFVLVEGSSGTPDKILALNPANGALEALFSAPNDQAHAITFVPASFLTEGDTLFVSYDDMGMSKLTALNAMDGSSRSSIGGQSYPTVSPVPSPAAGMTFNPSEFRLIAAQKVSTIGQDIPVFKIDPGGVNPAQPPDFLVSSGFIGAEGFNALTFLPGGGGPPPQIVGAGDVGKVSFIDAFGGFVTGFDTTPLEDIQGMAFDGGPGDLLLADAFSGQIYKSSLVSGPGGEVTGEPRALASRQGSTLLYVVLNGTPDQILVVNPDLITNPADPAPGIVQGPFDIMDPSGPTFTDFVEGAVVVGTSTLILADNGTSPPSLWRFPLNPDGTVDTSTVTILGPLPPFVNDIGGLALAEGSSNIIAYERFFDEFHIIDPSTGVVVGGSTVFDPDPYDQLWPTGGANAAASGSLFVANFGDVREINVATGDIAGGWFTPGPPFNIYGMTIVGDTMYFADKDTLAVYKAAKPGTPGVDPTTAGNYTATLTVDAALSAQDKTVTVPFTLVRVTQLDVQITSPADGSAFTSAELASGKIPVTGTVNDPTVTTVNVGVQLPETILFGKPDKLGPSTLDGVGLDAADAAQYTISKDTYAPAEDSLWHTSNVKPGGGTDPGNFLWYYGKEGDQSFNTPGRSNAGTLDTDTFTVGSATTLTFKTWYDSEPGFDFDQKFIDFCTGTPSTTTACTTLAQITDFMPPPTGPGPGPGPGPGFIAPGTVFDGSVFGKAWDFIFIPMFFVAPPPAPAQPVMVQVNLPITGFTSQTGFIRFRFDSKDDIENFFLGWLIDDVEVKGAGFESVSVTITKTDGGIAWSADFPLAEGTNTITANAANTAYDPTLTDSDSITVFLDSSVPQVTIDEPPLTKTTTTVTYFSTNNPSQTVTGGFVETTPDLLKVTLINSTSTRATALSDLSKVSTKRAQLVADLNAGTITATQFDTQLSAFLSDTSTLSTVLTEKLIATKKTFDPADPTFSQSIGLTEGFNQIAVTLTDKGGLRGFADIIILLDSTAPTLDVSLPVVYLVGDVSARPGDPIIFQVAATDAASGVAIVNFIPPDGGGTSTVPMTSTGDIPGAVLDQWQVNTSANFVLPVIVPTEVPPGTFSMNITATDRAGNSTTGQLQAVIVPTLQAFNVYLMPGHNLISMPLQPDANDDTVAETMQQLVPNINPVFQKYMNQVFGTGTPAVLADVVESVTWWSGGLAGVGAFKAFVPPNPVDPAQLDPADDIPEFGSSATSTVWNVGLGFWVKAREFVDDPAAAGNQIWYDPATVNSSTLAVSSVDVSDDAAVAAAVAAGLEPMRVFKQSAALIPGATGTPAPIKMTITGQFLEPGTVPPTFEVVQGWNLTGLHSETARTVSDFLRGVSVPTVKWTSLLEFQNFIRFPFQEGAELEIVLGAFNRLTETDTVEPGEGFWLFLNEAGLLTP